MRLRTLAIAVACFIAGMVTYAIMDRSVHSQDLASHWRVVENFHAYLRDPVTANVNPETGLPDDPSPSLAALVAAGELRHVDLVLPNVPSNREATLYWLQWASEHDDIVYASGNPSYTDFQPSGEQPVHLRLWFKESAVPAVQQLITDLEQLPSQPRSGDCQ